MRHRRPLPSRLPAHMHMRMRCASHALLSASAGNHQPVRRKQSAHPLRVVVECVLHLNAFCMEFLGLLLALAALATAALAAALATAAAAAAARAAAFATTAALATTAVTTAAVYRHG